MSAFKNTYFSCRQPIDFKGLIVFVSRMLVALAGEKLFLKRAGAKKR